MFKAGDRVEYIPAGAREEKKEIRKFKVEEVYEHHILCTSLDNKYRESFKPHELRKVG
ncbi:MAG: hypothetical protein HGA49_13305 [Eubacteriaceae bacterium]|nr:hypothetical protein [Eubacteriaceae bacterium]